MADQIMALLVAASQADRTAEQTLEQYLQENYAAFCGALATIIASEERDFVGRQMACLYFKNTLSAQSTSVQVEKHERWKQLDPKTRTEIKEAILSTLRTTKQPQLPHFCAVAAAQIAVIELPYKEWPTFVSSLAITSSSAAEQVKIAALDCLGYTCEQLATIEEMLPNTPELESGTVDAMLTTIVDGVQPSMPDKMRLAALTALKNSLCYIRKNMDFKDERDFILQAVGAAAGSTDDGVRSLAFQCLDTIAELYYEHLGEYMTAIYNLTTAVIQSNSEEDVKMSAIEVWSTVASMEQEYLFNERQEASLGIPASRSPSPQYIQAAAETLFPMMLQTLAIVDEDADEDSWTLQAAASNCIEVMSLTIEGRVIPLTIPFIQQHIQSPDWKFRDASIVAFMSIQEGPTTEEIGTYVKQSLDTLVAHFNDPSPVVQTSALHCVSAMCKLHFTTLEPPMVHKLLAAFMEKLQGPPVLAASACTGIFNVAQSVGKASQEDVDTNVLSEPMMPLMQQLLAVSDRPDGMEHNLRVGSMSAATALVSASARDSQSIFRELLPYIIEKTKSALGMQVVSQEETTARDQTLGQLCGLFQTLYQRMEKQDVMERTPEVMNLLLQVCHLRNGQCLEEAILTMGAVAANIEQDFVPYMQTFTPMLVHGLKSFSIESLVTVSVGVVVDLATAIGSAFHPFADAIMTVLMECLRDTSVYRDVKPVVFSSLGDIAMAIGAGFEPYLQMSLMLLMQAAQQQVPPDDPEILEFINSLRVSVLEAYSGIMIGLSEGGRSESFLGALTAVWQFLSFLANDSLKDEIVLQKAVALLGDLANEMPDPVKPIIQQPFVVQLVSAAQASSNDETREYANWTKEKLELVMRS